MALCRDCGERIKWIRTPKGKWMPADCRPVRVAPNRGTEIFVTDKGEIIKGGRTLPGAIGGGNIAAYVPHWASCPARKENK